MISPRCISLAAIFLLALPVLHARETQLRVGVINGLSVTDHTNKGNVMPLRAQLRDGTGEIHLKGQYGKEFKKSAQIAFAYAKKHAHEFGVDAELINQRDVDMHLPSYHIDGTSAGVAMLVAVMSAYTGRPTDSSCAMTGAMNEHGRVLPIGKLKEKIKGANDKGINNILAPMGNSNNYRRTGKRVKRDGVTFVENVREVLNRVLLPEEN